MLPREVKDISGPHPCSFTHVLNIMKDASIAFSFLDHVIRTGILAVILIKAEETHYVNFKCNTLKE